VFVEPKVTACGHTFCRFCIGEWTANDQQRNCPICRNQFSNFGPPQRHFQMENFVEKMYAFLSGPAASDRAALIADRTQLAAAAPSATADADTGEPGSLPATNNFSDSDGDSDRSGDSFIPDYNHVHEMDANN
jgi:hypothetical protein